MQAVDLLGDNPDPDEHEVREGIEGNLCRCTGYQNIVRAVQSAAQAMKPRHRTGGLQAHRDPRDRGGELTIDDHRPTHHPPELGRSPAPRKEDARLITGRTRWTDNIAPARAAAPVRWCARP